MRKPLNLLYDYFFKAMSKSFSTVIKSCYILVKQMVEEESCVNVEENERPKQSQDTSCLSLTFDQS